MVRRDQSPILFNTLNWEHGGRFSLDASVCIEGRDRAGLERLLCYCACPPFAREHLHTLDAGHLLYYNPKPRSDSPRDPVLTPLELIDKIAALIPPPRAHRHLYYGVRPPNSPMRAAVTAMAPMPVLHHLVQLLARGLGVGVCGQGQECVDENE